MDRYCSSVVHLLRGKELGFQNALTGNVTRCTKHKMLQMCGNMNDCNGLFDDRTYSYFTICHCTIRGFRDGNYIEEEEEEKIHGFCDFHNGNYNEEEEEEIICDSIDVNEDGYHIFMSYI